MTARWRKTPRPKGLRGIGSNPGYELREGEKVLIRVGAACDMGQFIPKGWYWAGFGQNTSDSLVKTAEQAKANADAWFKANRVLIAAAK